MERLYVLVTCAFFACLIATGSALKCYECNVWKAGYGHLCDNPRIRDDCTVCMKVHTTVEMGYYKNKPRKSEITSRICSKTRTTHFSHECHPYTAVAGQSLRCYCDTDLCNSAPKGVPVTLTLIGTVACLVLSIQRLLWH